MPLALVREFTYGAVLAGRGEGLAEASPGGRAELRISDSRFARTGAPPGAGEGQLPPFRDRIFNFAIVSKEN